MFSQRRPQIKRVECSLQFVNPKERVSWGEEREEAEEKQSEYEEQGKEDKEALFECSASGVGSSPVLRAHQTHE